MEEKIRYWSRCLKLENKETEVAIAINRRFRELDRYLKDDEVAATSLYGVSFVFPIRPRKTKNGMIISLPIVTQQKLHEVTGISDYRIRRTIRYYAREYKEQFQELLKNLQESSKRETIARSI